MKIKNKEIRLSVNGKELFAIHNTITDNGLDWFVFKNLADDTANDIFPQFKYDTTGDTSVARGNGFKTCYIKYDTAEALTTSSTSMGYDEKFIDNDYRGAFNNGNELTRTYSYTVESANTGKVIETIGFGIDDDHYTDFLFAYLQVGFLGITVTTDDIIEISRIDEASSDVLMLNTDYTSYEYGLQYALEYYVYLLGIQFIGNTIDTYKYYSISTLSITNSSAGVLTITGFDDFIYFDGELFYPSDTLFPSDTLYPQSQNKLTRVQFYFYDLINSQYVFGRIELTNANISNAGGTVTITYAYERGA